MPFAGLGKDGDMLIRQFLLADLVEQYSVRCEAFPCVEMCPSAKAVEANIPFGRSEIE